MIVVNDPVFNTDPDQPNIVHGTLDPYTDYGLAELVALPVGTLYISRAAQVGDPCGTTFSAGCLFLKSGTAGSICAPLGSRSDWCKLGCHGLLTGTELPSTGEPFCSSEMGQIYERTVEGCVMHYIKSGSECGSSWISLSKGCVYPRDATPVGVTDDACLCALPVGAFVNVPNIGTYLKTANNCDGNDWRTLMPDTSNLEDMRNVTHNPDDSALAKPTYDVATRTLNIPPHWIVSIRRNAQDPLVGYTTVAPGATSQMDYSVVDINTSENNPVPLTTNQIIVPFNGFYRVSVLITLAGKAQEAPWRANLTFNATTLQKWLWTAAPALQLSETNFTDNFMGPLTGGTTLAFDITNLDTTDSIYVSSHLTLELLGV